ncbi:MAG: glycosyl hydrolase 2 galactose-binding domain-containing protein [Lachnospiraceae bacterium]
MQKVKKISLDGTWRMQCMGEEWMDASVPGSVYSNLIANGKMEDPYWGENEYQAIELGKKDYQFERTFEVTRENLETEELYLVFEGIDTIADIFLNEEKVASVSDMHRTYRFSVKDKLQEGENTLRVYFHSALNAAKEKYENRPVWGVDTTVKGFSQIRKAHYMFGWDWGPVLADMGFYRSVYLLAVGEAAIVDAHIRQKHEEETVTVSCQLETRLLENAENVVAKISVKAPDKELFCEEKPAEKMLTLSVVIQNPKLWWPNGVGEQPLYEVRVQLVEKDTEQILDEKKVRLGLRTLTVSQEADEWGKEFCFCVNGKKIFAMGANYVPQDNILPWCSYERTKTLIETCREANYNCIRVWGGGYYPDDYFYELCDENGLIVWQDFMFACASYWLTPEFRENIIAEAKDVIRRLRHHACLGIWCGNNEIESAWVGWGIPQEQDLIEDYQMIFEKILPKLCEKLDPDHFYWPSSPSSGGGFKDIYDDDQGDQHYWKVWHSMAPISDFEKSYFRFCSEYGFVSLPSVKTIAAFAEKEEQNLCSPVMELHHRCQEGNKKLLYYISEVMRYPNGLEELVYASQLLQADAIRANVEHMRRNRGRCMGSVYWQINDSNPCISWSGIDYFGRWKALQYYAKKFYAPIAASVTMEDGTVTFFATNETRQQQKGTLQWRLRNAGAEILKEGTLEIEIPQLSTIKTEPISLAEYVTTREQKRSTYMEYSVWIDGKKVADGNTLFVPCKEFQFEKPTIAWDVRKENGGFLLKFSSDVYAKGVYLELSDADVIFSDNWFDINGAETVTISISEKEAKKAKLTQPDEIRSQMRILTAAQIGR